MAKTPFVLEDLQFALRMKIYVMRQSNLADTYLHAFLLGAIDGLTTGAALLKAGYSTSFSTEIAELLEKYNSGSIGSLADLVDLVNKNVITKPVLKPSDFASGKSYGKSVSSEYYRDGFMMAHSWAIRLYWSARSHDMEKPTAASLSIRQIESMNLFSIL